MLAVRILGCSEAIFKPNGSVKYDVEAGRMRLGREKSEESCKSGLRKCSGSCVQDEQETEMLNLLRTSRACERPRHATLLPSQRSRAGE